MPYLVYRNEKDSIKVVHLKKVLETCKCRKNIENCQDCNPKEKKKKHQKRGQCTCKTTQKCRNCHKHEKLIESCNCRTDEKDCRSCSRRKNILATCTSGKGYCRDCKRQKKLINTCLCRKVGEICRYVTKSFRCLPLA